MFSRHVVSVRKNYSMKITRALGLLLFLFVAQFLLSNVFQAFSGAASASLRALEAAAVLSEERFETIR